MRRGHAGLALLVILIAVYVSRHGALLAPQSAQTSAASASADTGDVDTAFRNHSTNVIVTASGTVARVLADDTQGLQHQRFVLRMPSGITVLVAHDIDEAPRIPGLTAGTGLSAHGEYVWNAEGGILHWTHHDSRGRHAPGWIDYEGRRYQ